MKTPRFKYSVKVEITLSTSEIEAILSNAKVYQGVYEETKPVLNRLGLGTASLDRRDIDVLIQATTDWADEGRRTTAEYLHKKFQTVRRALLKEECRANNYVEI